LLPVANRLVAELSLYLKSRMDAAKQLDYQRGLDVVDGRQRTLWSVERGQANRAGRARDFDELLKRKLSRTMSLAE
jgi:hypothetical protein